MYFIFYIFCPSTFWRCKMCPICLRLFSLMNYQKYITLFLWVLRVTNSRSHRAADTFERVNDVGGKQPNETHDCVNISCGLPLFAFYRVQFVFLSSRNWKQRLQWSYSNHLGNCTGLKHIAI